MSAIDFAVADIFEEIPEEILIETLNLGESRTSKYATSLEFKLINKVIKSIVLRDTKILNGVERVVSLAGLKGEFDDYNCVTYHIPPDRVDDREIIAVRSVAPVPLMLSDNGNGVMPNLGTSFGGEGRRCDRPSMLQRAANKVKRSNDLTNVQLNVITNIVGYNTVEIQGMRYFNNMNLGIRCLIAYDDKLSTLQPPSFIHFANMCVMATKAYIYKELIVKMGIGKLDFGEELGVFTSIVEGYADQREAYKEFRNDAWKRVMKHNDAGYLNRHLKGKLHIGY